MENFILSGFNIWIIVKFFSLVILGMYIVFAFVVTRQVKVMTETLTLGFESVAKYLSLFHLLFAVLVFIIALIVL
jgi:small-conductance mechanosensitive channel